MPPRLRRPPSGPVGGPMAPRDAPIPESVLISIMAEQLGAHFARRTGSVPGLAKRKKIITERLKALQDIVKRSGGANLSIEDLVGFSVTTSSPTSYSSRGESIRQFGEKIFDVGGKALQDPGFGQGIIDTERAAQRRRSNARLELNRRRFFDTGSDPAGA